MSELRINNITDRSGSCGPIIAGVSTVSSTSHMVVPSGPTEMRKSPSVLDLSGNQQISSSGGRGRGITGGGFVSPSSQNVMDFIEIATSGSAQDFGDLTVILRNIATCASSTRGIFASGQTPSVSNVICFTTISSSGGANDFGDLRAAMTNSNDGVLSDNTRGIILYGGPTSLSQPTAQGTLDFITIPTIGNSSVFGELSVARRHAATMASPTRGVFATGKEDGGSTYLKVIDFVIIQTQGTAVTFGEISTNGREQSVGAGNKTRGLIAGGLGSGPTPFQSIDFITLATEGNGQDFGDLAANRFGMSSMSSSTRATFAGGSTPSNSNTIEVVTISTTANATDFGDLTVARTVPQGLSDVHGGIGD